MSKVVWLPEAVEDTRRLRQFLEDQSPAAAARASQVLRAGARRLAEFPEIGHPLDDGTNRRELFLPFGTGGYILRYRLDGQIVAIIRVWHTREQRYQAD
ncbi:type II toxin-antitoxin system RelE/ParE family toxin [Methylomonas sp. UP202]|uniref:type II toxin-antitoxin system RelE/ParE family toxin n=1 Tax=Methylomonas sp. UP202 TaxID=3040943 RepID=UPI002478C021|nr:type II toxin-antitoxin system RelE/ParE family toxin [Methylomonas sp. UP202]WGS88625.1 type II toxin-antitoxin system RelE/ParE family toxin [Methylomonas sp. UP202]